MENKTPLILVFYLSRALCQENDIMSLFAETVNNIIAEKNANIISFFLPTDGEETVKCINPVLVDETTILDINKMIEDIKNNFDIGKVDLKNED
jgi:hypothetical protein